MLKKIFIILPICCFLQACNLTDESQIVKEEGTNIIQAKDLVKTSIQQVGFNRSAMAGRDAGLITQQMHSLAPVLYGYTSSSFDNVWSSAYYRGSLADLKEMQLLAENENSTNLQAIALILMAHEYAYLTNMFGDIPFSEALNGESILNPKYDRQEEVYNGIVRMVDNAIELLGNNTGDGQILNEDILFGGDLTRWKKFAYGLKARFLFNQRNISQSNDQQILDLIDQSFLSLSEQANMKFNAEFRNPQYLFPEERPSTINIGNFLRDELLDTNDPRIPKFMINDSDGNMDDWWHYIKGEFSGRWNTEDAEIPILSFAELMFMKAEIYVNLNPSESSFYLREAITASMEDNQVAMTNETEQYINTFSDISTDDTETMIEKITMESFKAYFGNNHMQSWNNFRRTGFPKISSIQLNPSDVNPSMSIPKRFIYPSSEYDYNLGELQAAIDRQGGALLDNALWVFGN